MNNILVRECTFNDEIQVLELWKRNHIITSEPKKNWKMLWLQNPAYNKNWPIGWVLESDKKIVGSLSNLPQTYYLENKKIKTATARGFVVDIQARSSSIKLASHFFNQKNIDLFLGTTANQSSSEVLKFFDCLPLPFTNYKYVLQWIINIQDVIRHEIYKRIGFSNFFTDFLSLIFTPFLTILIKILGHGFKKNNVNWHGKIEIIPIKDINVDFDKLWKRKKYELPKILLSDRSAETLRWHFSKFDKYSDRTKILTARLDEELLGYLIVDIEDLPGSSFKRLRINDIFVSQNSVEIIDALIYKAFIFAKKKNLHSIIVVGFNTIVRKRFMILKPIKRKLDYMPFLFKTIKSNLLSKLLKSDTWYSGPYDGDSSL